MDIQSVPTEDLERELEKRRAKPPPVQKASFSTAKLRIHLINHLKYINDNGRTEKDYKQWTYEIVMEAFYGVEIWDWINEKIN